MSGPALPPGFQLVEEPPAPPAGFQLVTDRAGPTLRQKLQSSFPMRVVQGARDAIDAGAQMLPRGLEAVTSGGGIWANPVSNYFGSEARRVDEMVGQNERDYQASRQATGQEGFDAARLTGNVVSPANFAVAARLPTAVSTVGRFATGAAAGAAGGAMTPVTEVTEESPYWQQKGAQMGVGAMTGGPLGPIFGKIGDAVGRRVQAFRANSEAARSRAAAETDNILVEALNEVGARFDDLPSGLQQDMRRQVFDALKTGKKLDAAALMRKADFESVGIPATRGQITRDPNQFATERNLRGVANVGEPLMNVFGTQNRLMSERVGGFGGKDAPSAFSAGERFLESLNRVDDKMRVGVSDLYKKARASTGRDLDIPLQGFAQDYARIVRDFGDDNLPAAIRSRASEFGWTGGKQTKVFSVDDAEDLIQAVNKNYDPGKRAQAGALDALRAAMKNALLAADDQGGAYAPAREAAAKRFQLHDMVPALKAAVSGTIAPDDFVRKFLVNGKTNDVRELALLFRKDDPAALNEMRQQIGAQLLRAAFGENPAGDMLFRPSSYAQTLRSIGDEKLSAIFNRDEVLQMKALGRVGAYINATPTAAPVNYSNNSGYLLSAFSKVPGVPSVVSLLSAGAKAVTNRSTVRNAVAAEVPRTPADLTPESYRTVMKALGLGSVAGGEAAAQPLR